MKRIVVLVLCMVLILAPAADAAIGSKGLTVNGGETLVVKAGEKRLLWVRDGASGLPVWKGLTFYSDNVLVFSVGLHSGLLRGNAVGTARLTVVDERGNCAYLQVRVARGRKGSAWWLLVFVPLILLIKRGHLR